MPGFAVIDFETTGIFPERTDRVVEAGIVLLNEHGLQEHSWTTLINPKRDIGATHIHRITGAELTDAPEFSEITDHILHLLEGRTLVAHNASFDMRFLHQELLRAGYQVPQRPEALCSMKWSGRLLGTAKLHHCCEALGIELKNAHTALGDAEATGKLLSVLLQQTRHVPEWAEDIYLASITRWPLRHTPSPQPKVALRHSGAKVPHSWMLDAEENTWVPGVPEHEARYLLTLSNALLDFHISHSEGRELMEVAKDAGISKSKMLELHRAHLGRLAVEVLSDGIIEKRELLDLHAAAACMGLGIHDVDLVLKEAQKAPAQAREQFLNLGDRIVFTGELSIPREEWIARLRQTGLATGGVTKSTRALVTSDPDSLSGKAQKARQYGIPILTEEAFNRYFKDYLNKL